MRAWRILLILLGAVYLVQIRTPLRLGVDSVVLMAEGESVARGTGFLDHGAKTPFPPGYPAVLAVLLRLGLAQPPVLMAFNLALLGVGLAALHLLLRGPLEQPGDVTLEIVCAFLLSYVVIKHTAMPLTDVPFFGLSVSCIAILAYAERQPLNRRFYFAILGAGLVLFGALALRRVGVALLPAFVWAGCSQKELRQLLRRSRKARTASLSAAVLIIILITLFCAWSYTIKDYRVAAEASSIASIALVHAAEIGELATNVPQRQIPAAVRTVSLFALGGAVALAILTALIQRGRRLCSLDIYFVAYFAIIFAWPYSDPRFWIPIPPFIMAYSRIGLLVWFRSGRWKPLLWAFKFAFALAGVAALIYSTRLSFSGPNFPTRYTTSGPLRDTYCAALNTKSRSVQRKGRRPQGC